MSYLHDFFFFLIVKNANGDFQVQECSLLNLNSSTGWYNVIEKSLTYPYRFKEASPTSCKVYEFFTVGQSSLVDAYLLYVVQLQPTLVSNFSLPIVQALQTPLQMDTDLWSLEGELGVWRWLVG